MDWEEGGEAGGELRVKENDKLEGEGGWWIDWYLVD